MINLNMGRHQKDLSKFHWQFRHKFCLCHFDWLNAKHARCSLINLSISVNSSYLENLALVAGSFFPGDYFVTYFVFSLPPAIEYNPERDQCVTLSRVTLRELELHRWGERVRIKRGSFDRSACSTGLCSRSLSPTIRLDGGPVAYRKWGRRRERTQKEMVEQNFYPRGGSRPPNRRRWWWWLLSHLPRWNSLDFHHLRPRMDHLHRPPRPRSVCRWYAFGEDTRLYNYDVPVIERSKLSFPASREQEVRGPTGGIARNMRIRPGCAVSCSTSFSLSYHIISRCILKKKKR